MMFLRDVVSSQHQFEKLKDEDENRTYKDMESLHLTEGMYQDDRGTFDSDYARISNRLKDPRDYEEDILESLDPVDMVTQEYDEEKLKKVYYSALIDRIDESQKTGDKKAKKRCRNRCLFCSRHSHEFPLEPMNIPLLTKFMTTAGEILPRHTNGLCKKMQSKVAHTIKHARSLGLFSRSHGIFQVKNPARFELPEMKDTRGFDEEMDLD